MRPEKFILNSDREAVVCDDLFEWGRWIEGSSNRRVAFDELGGGVTVSTVFLGLDHQFGDGPPLLF